MADIFREVEEELRKDKALAWWKRYSPFIYGLAAVVVLGTGGYQVWQAVDLDRRTEASNAYSAAARLASGDDLEGAIAGFAELKEDGAAGYALLAAMQEARLLAEQGRRGEAVAVWDRIAGQSSAGPAFQGAATLLSVMHSMEDGDPAVLKARLDPLTAAGQPFRATALELSGILALQEGDAETASSLFAQIADDPQAPSGTRRRAAQMLDRLKAEGGGS